jgi:Glycosyl hydrolases family 2, sugar binding domain/Glycosyl hydrolases family 2/Glycosyl hydrolases family 2, TIM barrel domain
LDKTRRRIVQSLLMGCAISDWELLGKVPALGSRLMNLDGADGGLLAALLPGADPQAKPVDLLRLQTCVNGDWECVLNAPGEKIPGTGWLPRRAPAMPIATDPPTQSVWYRQKFDIPRAWDRPARRFFLRLEKAGHYAAIYWNGHLAGEHFGQYLPCEADITSFLRPGATNEAAIFVHNASGSYVRPGVTLMDPMEGNAYRGATQQPFKRNWVGIVDDIYLGWRPDPWISDVFVVPSVRQKRLAARVSVAQAETRTAELTVRADVLDNGRTVKRLPPMPVAPGGTIELAADWRDPVLWGPEPYGRAKLYVLRTDLLSGGKLVDRRFVRFGFREVWVQGRDVLLNGKKLWMAGTYFDKLAPIRYLNDRHSQSLMLGAMQDAGLNTLHGHWDELGKTWLDLCDEMGMLVLGAFFCDGRPQIQSRADSGWVAWMAATCGEWVKEVRNHPSIVMWRPLDVLPENVAAEREKIYALMAEQVRQNDGTRPVADGSDIEPWAQSPGKRAPAPGPHPARQRGSEEAQGPKHRASPALRFEYDDGSEMAQHLAAATKPFLTKEIYTGFADVKGLSSFFEVFYKKSFEGGGTGIIVQHLPVVRHPAEFDIKWLSASGQGNRDSGANIQEENLPNWCDAGQPVGSATPYCDLFSRLYRQFMKQPLPKFRGELAGEILVSGLEPGELVVMVAEAPDVTNSVGVRAAADGTAWVVVPVPGRYRLFHQQGSLVVRALPRPLPRTAGYASVERLVLPSRHAHGRESLAGSLRLAR